MILEHLTIAIITFSIILGYTAPAFVPSQPSFHRCHMKSTQMNSATNKNDFYDFFDEYIDDDDDNEEYFRNMSASEKKKLNKSFFADVLNYDETIMKPDEVHIILFNPNTEREGVHTIEFPKDSGNNIILAFECRVECEQFSMKLRDQHFFDPVVSLHKYPFMPFEKISFPVRSSSHHMFQFIASYDTSSLNK